MIQSKLEYEYEIFISVLEDYKWAVEQNQSPEVIFEIKQKLDETRDLYLKTLANTKDGTIMNYSKKIEERIKMIKSKRPEGYKPNNDLAKDLGLTKDEGVIDNVIYVDFKLKKRV